MQLASGWSWLFWDYFSRHCDLMASCLGSFVQEFWKLATDGSTAFCAGVTWRFHKTPCRGFFFVKKSWIFYICFGAISTVQILTPYIDVYFLLLSEQIDKFHHSKFHKSSRQVFHTPLLLAWGLGSHSRAIEIVTNRTACLERKPGILKEKKL